MAAGPYEHGYKLTLIQLQTAGARLELCVEELSEGADHRVEPHVAQVLPAVNLDHIDRSLLLGLRHRRPAVTTLKLDRLRDLGT